MYSGTSTALKKKNFWTQPIRGKFYVKTCKSDLCKKKFYTRFSHKKYCTATCQRKFERMGGVYD